MQVTATEAKNRFGTMCAYAKKAPVTVLKDGRPDTVIVSINDFEANYTLKGKSEAQRIKEFQETYKDWFSAYNSDLEQNGVWCEAGMAWGTSPLRD